MLKLVKRRAFSSSSPCFISLKEDLVPPGDPPSDYRFLLPIQTRVSDTVPDVSTLFYNFADTIVNNYLLWYCKFGKQAQNGRVMAHTEHNFRSSITYPQVLLGAARVEKIGRSSVHYGVSFYSPKMDYEIRIPKDKRDILSQMGVTLLGRIAAKHDPVFAEVSESYYLEPSLFGRLVHVFVDVDDKPVERLPGYLHDAMSAILYSPAKL